MKVSYELTNVQIESLKNLGVIPLKEKEKESWKPKLFDYSLADNINIGVLSIFTRNNISRINNLKKSILEISRIDFWACENNYKINFGKEKRNWYICKNFNVWCYNYSNWYVPGTMYMNEEGAKKLVKLLNEGVFNFE